MGQNNSYRTVSKIVELQDEIQLKERLIEIGNDALEKQLQLIQAAANVDKEQAYALLMKYRSVWEFAGNVSASGDSIIITLPKKEALSRGIKKGTPIMVAVKKLRFYGK